MADPYAIIADNISNLSKRELFALAALHARIGNQSVDSMFVPANYPAKLAVLDADALLERLNRDESTND